MKNTFGTIGLGLAGAVAAVGLMSAGVQTAQAQLELQPLGATTFPGNGNPAVSYNGTNDTYTYNLSLVNPSGSADNLLLTSTTSAGYYQGTFSISGFVNYVAGSFVQSGGPTGQSWSLNYTSTPDTLTLDYTGTDITASPGTTVSLGEFQFNSTSGPSAIGNYSSTVTQTDPSGTPAGYDGYSSAVQVPNSSVVAAPLPLPAAFWPGLLTLGGMAVVGGLRLRRRTV